jgi:hypothetical protein
MSNNTPPDQPPPMPPSSPGAPAPGPDQPKNELAQTAEKALESARDGLKEGVATWKTLDSASQIYLGGLAAAFLMGSIFSAATVDVKIAGIQQQAGNVGTALSMGGNGALAVLAALAGIVLWVWNFKSAKKEAWAPKALLGCAAGSAALYLLLMLRSGGGEVPFAEVDVDMTLLGFWVPFAGAIAASVIAYKNLAKGA